MEVATGKIPGGGPIESIIRMPMQSGSMTELDLGNDALEGFVKAIDYGIMYPLSAVGYILPTSSFEYFVVRSLWCGISLTI